MIFSSATFLIFFAALLSLYAMARSYPQRAAIILVGSIIFYATWKPAYLLLLGASLSINYMIYHGLQRSRSRSLLIGGVALNLGVLGFYKYLGLFIETALSIGQLVGMDVVSTRVTWIDWALPLGISFYTFHMLSVMIDVYRGEWTRPISFLSWTMYVTFFPHMIAGPILRASQLVAQLEQLKPLRWADIRMGGLIFGAGLAKKVLLADNLSLIVDNLYSHPQHLDFFLAWFATVGFGLQIYFDFSGYSEMAIGLARIFGVNLPRNFRYPYVSRSPREFWQRWHITLSRWLRDYLYISLGGSRCSMSRNMANLMITMVLGGMWHGAGWNFLFWGFLHGIYLIAHRILLMLYDATGIIKHSKLAGVISWMGLPITLILVSFTWVFFRAAHFHDAWSISMAMLGIAIPSGPYPEVRGYLKILVLSGVLVAACEPWLVEVMQRRGVAWWWSVPFPLRGLAYAGAALVLIVFGGATQKFIYFDF